MKVSVVVSTFNRPIKVQRTIKCLLDQSIGSEEYEIVLVDNGSKEEVLLPENLNGRNVQLYRFEENQERAISRSKGVELASGELILFSDDDLLFEKDFLNYHLAAHKEWENLMAIGKIILPRNRLSEPGIKFRQELELTGIPGNRGLVSQPNFGTAANMSIKKDIYLQLGGFDSELAGIEDQDFAMRHSANGGNIAYLPEAVAVHDDDWLDFRSFCKRQAYAAEWAVPFSARYPEFEDSQAREKINGFIYLGKEPFSLSAKKAIKSVLATRTGKAIVSSAIRVLEIVAPKSNLLSKAYSQTLGIYVQEGYRKGLRKYS
ncbi:MAG: glycosyltransferase family 2 protein [Pyrinomonadaceae bacterium]